MEKAITQSFDRVESSELVSEISNRKSSAMIAQSSILQRRMLLATFQSLSYLTVKNTLRHFSRLQGSITPPFHFCLDL
jgi:hypothetical protein